MCADDVLPVDGVAVRLSEFVDHSLVVVERRHERARYRLLERLRGYAEARLVAQGARGHAMDDHETVVRSSGSSCVIASNAG